MDDDYNYASDFNKNVCDGTILEDSLTKLVLTSSSADHRKRTADMLYVSSSNTFVQRLYQDKDSPLYHGLCYEHALALRKYICQHKWSGKYAFDYFSLGEHPNG